MITVSQKVTIKLKVTSTNYARLGDNATMDFIHNKHKIGSSFEPGGTTPLRGLTFEEERKFLPNIIGVSADSDKFTAACDNYWKNISTEVPAETGVELEIGMRYPDQAAADAAEKETVAEKVKVLEARVSNRFYVEKFDVRTKVGTPINLTDYILYRYCLRYSRVAQTPDDIFKSPKIMFYIVSQEAERAVQDQKLRLRRKAYQHYLDIINDRTKASNVSLLLKSRIQAYNLLPSTTTKLSTDNESNIDLTLEAMAVNYPNDFITACTDKQLIMKAFIERCIDANELRRLPNTDAIVFGDNTSLGNTVDEAIVFLTTDANKEVLNTLKARLKAFDKS
jgi:hypothetical protein